MLVAGRAFFVGPGCLVCPWAAARPLAVRAAICARRARHPLRMICLVRSGRSVCRWAAARPRDRHTRACGSEWSISRPALALPPPTGTATVPSGPSGALHTCGARSLFGSSTRRLEARPGPATAHGHHSQAHPISEPSHAKPSPPALTPLIREPTPNFACNSLATLSNFEF